MLVSTRDISQQSVSYEQALLGGLAPDGGLYTPTELPRISLDEIPAFRAQPYHRVFTWVHEQLTGGELSHRTISRIAQIAFDPKLFPTSEQGVVTPVSYLGGKIYVQDLSTGPTAAFKDMALQPVVLEMDHFLERRGETLTLLGATSGDTGSAAEAAVGRSDNLRIFMLSPQVGMSAFQAAQMGELTGNNVFNLSIDGRFDDCQTIVKAISKDPEFSNIGAVNSINIGRIYAQVPYHLAGYLQLLRRTGGRVGDPYDVVVPSGNFGNALSAHYARRMGVPIREIILATNENDVLDTLVQTGVYRARDAEVTSSPSMDIGKSSNFERFAFELFRNSPYALRRYMDQFEETGEVKLSNIWATPNDSLRLQMGLNSGRSTHDDRIRTIRSIWRSARQVIDPHTADGVFVAQQHAWGDLPVVVLSTAKPVKFEDTIEEALGSSLVPPREQRFQNLGADTEKGFVKLPADIDAVKDFLRQHTV